MSLPETPLPDAGGSYVRDPDTGALQSAPLPEEAAPPPSPQSPSPQPAAKPVTKPVKEA
jgi:hypothetical protein